jgi:hypothetical protein
MTDTADRDLSAADHALMEAIDADVAGNKMYPDGATFIDAEHPSAGKAVAQAAAEGHVVVLCSQDGTRQVLYPSRPAAA